ncbi:MAG TPA: nucleoside triphosphate pyrophosphohydrolase [bacterium]|nr:nucleoside triphosphate pyrophosphohydrolase [bacterium]HPN43608.1 nucleoside triphosphate pyrophosphohydrolase [bacterium]
MLLDTIEKKFARLVEIMAMLRSPEGCPWDREQTHKSLRQHLLEEAYEVIETIDEEHYDKLPEELGDLLLQIIFHAQMAAENNRFNIGTVLDHINEKLVRRHPHVFGTEVVETAAEQVVLWERTKINKEGKKSAIDGIPKLLPALIRAYRMQNKAATVGFDWGSIEPVWDKVSEETQELKEACKDGKQEEIEGELGDLLFSIVNLARFLKINPEDALRKTISKFERRFRLVEEDFKNRGESIHDATLAEMDKVWDRVKAAEHKTRE